jgi:uncharacterized protein (DUF3820 family)
MPDPIVPFGKFKGKRCSEIEDVKYLDWLIGQDWLLSDLKSQITAHLKTRPEWRELDEE